MPVIAKPSTAPFRWATGSALYRSPDPIPTPRQETGFVNGDPADPLEVNSLLGNTTDWVAYMGQLSPSTGSWAVTSLRIVDDIGGADIGELTDETGTLDLSSAGDMRFSPGAEWGVRFGGGIAVRMGGDTDYTTGFIPGDFDFRLSFGDTAGDGTGYPTYAWNLSPALGGWTPTAASTSVGVGIYQTLGAGSGIDDNVHIENQTGGTTTLYARTPLKFSAAIDEDGAVVRWTVVSLTVVFADDSTAIPIVSLIRMSKDGNATQTSMASCSPTSSATRQVVVDTTITSPDLDWANYSYFLIWQEASVADNGFSRGVEQVIVNVRTRAGA